VLKGSNGDQRIGDFHFEVPRPGSNLGEQLVLPGMSPTLLNHGLVESEGFPRHKPIGSDGSVNSPAPRLHQCYTIPSGLP
jgi:hypothetical protein